MNTSTRQTVNQRRLTNFAVENSHQNGKLGEKWKKWLQNWSGGVTLSLCLSALAATQVQAATYSFTKIADTKSYPWQSISTPVMNDSGTVAFLVNLRETQNISRYNILYTSNGNQLTEIGNSGTISSSIYSVEGINNNGTIVLRAGAFPGILTISQNGFITRIASSSFGGGGSQVVSQPRLNDLEEVVYLYWAAVGNINNIILTRPNPSNSIHSVYIASAALLSSSPPNNTRFIGDLGPFDINNNSEVVFAATSRQDGTRAIYTSSGGSVSRLVETSAGQSDALYINDSGDVALSTGYTISLFHRATGIWNVIFKASGQYRGLGVPAFNNNAKLAFSATLALGETGIYTGADPVKDKVIASGDTLFGSTVKSVRFSRQGLNNKDQIVFQAELTDGTQGVFLAEPVSDVTSEQEPQIPLPEEAFTISKVVDDVDFLLTNPAIDGNTIVFNISQGIYKISDGVLSMIADKNTAIPGSNLTFSRFFAPVIESGNVVFGASGSNSSAFTEGIYIQRGETLSVVVDNNTPIPGGGGRKFSSLGIYALDRGNVAFRDFNQQGIYLSHDRTLELIADRNTPIPGGTGNFSSFGDVALSGDRVVFSTGGQGQFGVYQSRDGSLEVVADTNTNIPGGVGNFTGFSNPGIDGDNIVFGGSGANSQQGIYIRRDGVLKLLVDNNTKVPGGRRTFDSFSNPVIKGDIVAFAGNVDNIPIGIYIYKGNTLLKVVDFNHRLDGKKLSYLSLGRDALNNSGSATFTARFTDGSRGIYRADLITQP
ncbi:DUF7453 family protein [Iningainema tapete]|uniref:Uncharacterized protein n=1 Tax=Iningainema tapete BLCC-T55 TaxID=2748662 RepID=A0A8J6XPF7_9CYAN|nr:choice-of-anchor tandem repeat NxxGxxAF-containing protein [Iningainema tapete]MBD2776861.1 hypothetical protein [Iningainema tapete BLCC-T55]